MSKPEKMTERVTVKMDANLKAKLQREDERCVGSTSAVLRGGDGISPEDRWRLMQGCICKLDKRKSSGAVDCCGAVSDHKIEVDLMLFTDMIRVGNVI